MRLGTVAKPEFVVWCEDYGESKNDDGTLIEADDEAAAASIWAERHDDRGDYDIAHRGHQDRVFVQVENGSAPAVEFDIFVHTSRHYNAEPTKKVKP